LDERAISIGGKRTYLWRAVNQEGEILNVAEAEREAQLQPDCVLGIPAGNR
jgi:transposase-like protein